MKRIIGVILTILAAVLVILWVGPKENPADGSYWNINSAQPEGARGMALLLEALGMPINLVVTLPTGDDRPPVLVLNDFYREKDRTKLELYAQQGGTVIQVAGDQLERLTYYSEASIPRSRKLEKTCTWPELADVEAVRINDTYLQTPEEGSLAEGCFHFDSAPWIIREKIGDGVIYTLNDGQAFTNAYLEANDNAVLLVRLIEHNGTKPDRVLRYRPIDLEEFESPELVDLVPTVVWLVIAHLFGVFALFIYQQGIRPNRVVREEMMTPLPGSSSVSAFGHYLWASPRVADVARLAREDTIRALARTLHISPDDPAQVVLMCARHSGMYPQQVWDLLYGEPPQDRASLYTLLIELSSFSSTLT